jgi:hypothetical protein
MRKTDNKIDNQLRLVLTDVCETALKEIDGFQWLTHLVNYSHFPKSLKVVCIFDTNENLSNFMSNGSRKDLESLIQLKLAGISVNVKNVSDHIAYDTEQNCEHEHNGNWAERLS